PIGGGRDRAPRGASLPRALRRACEGGGDLRPRADGERRPGLLRPRAAGGARRGRGTARSTVRRGGGRRGAGLQGVVVAGGARPPSSSRRRLPVRLRGREPEPVRRRV